jgi:probable F420-dependent oxidoreductase
MKIRFGVAPGTDLSVAGFPALVDRLEADGIDSLWLSELVFSGAIEPMVGLTHALARTERLKVGTSVTVLPGRHPALVAKQLASLAALAPRRVLPVFGLRPANPGELPLFPVPDKARGAVFDESLLLLRRLLTEDVVDHTGEHFTLTGARIRPRPARLDIWLGGSAEAGMRRIGRYADGWLGSLVSPARAGRLRQAIIDSATAAGREIEDDHYGLSLLLAPGGLSPDLAERLRQRGQAEEDPRTLVASSWDHLHELVDGYVANGLSKFVVRPSGELSTEEFLDGFVHELLPRQN